MYKWIKLAHNVSGALKFKMAPLATVVNIRSYKISNSKVTQRFSKVTEDFQKSPEDCQGWTENFRTLSEELRRFSEIFKDYL